MFSVCVYCVYVVVICVVVGCSWSVLVLAVWLVDFVELLGVCLFGVGWCWVLCCYGYDCLLV